MEQLNNLNSNSNLDSNPLNNSNDLNSITNTNTNTIKDKRTPDVRSSGTLLNIGVGEFLLFGGGNRDRSFNDIWLLNVMSLRNDAENKLTGNNEKFEINWLEIKTCNHNIFSPRFGCVGVKSTSTEDNKKFTIWLHGGQNASKENESQINADMLSLNFQINTNNIEFLNVKNYVEYPLNILTFPVERNSHTIATFIGDTEIAYIFGGGNGKGLLNDLWEFNLQTTKFNQIKIEGDNIPAREMHGMIAYTNKNKEKFLYIFGGRSYENIDNKMHRFNLSTNQFEFVCDLPTSLCTFSYASYKYFIIIYGGTDGKGISNDIIIYNIVNQKWAKSKIQINIELINNDHNLVGFIGRISSMMSVDLVAENLVIFGGSSVHIDSNHTYVVDLKELLDENNLVPY